MKEGRMKEDAPCEERLRCVGMKGVLNLQTAQKHRLCDNKILVYSR